MYHDISLCIMYGIYQIVILISHLEVTFFQYKILCGNNFPHSDVLMSISAEASRVFSPSVLTFLSLLFVTDSSDHDQPDDAVWDCYDNYGRFTGSVQRHFCLGSCVGESNLQHCSAFR